MPQDSDFVYVWTDYWDNRRRQNIQAVDECGGCRATSSRCFASWAMVAAGHLAKPMRRMGILPDASGRLGFVLDAG